MNTPEPVIDFTDLSQWKTLSEIEQENPYLKKSTLQWLMRKKETNGLDKIIKKFGRVTIAHSAGLSLWISQK